MTDYSDIPQANVLHAEQERVTAAIQMLDTGGTLANLTIMPGPQQGTMVMMPSQISTQGSPVPPETLANVRAWLVQRSSDIADELTALGVTNTRKH